MANKNKHLKENVKQKNSKKRAVKTTAPKAKKNKNEKFNFDNEIVIGVNVIPKNQKDKPLQSKNDKNKIKKSTKPVKLDNKNVKNKKEVKEKNKKVSKDNKISIKNIIKIIFLIAIIIGAIIFTMTTPLFNITEIDIKGNNRISKERIESLSKIVLNTNTFQYSKREIIKNIKEEPYLKEINIKRKLPNIMEIHIQERERNFIISNMGNYIYLDDQGYVLEITNEPEQLPEIVGLTTNYENLAPGDRLSDEDLEKLNVVVGIIETFKSNDIKENITSISVENKNDYCIIMKDEMKKIHLGNANNINDRILMLKEILTKEKGKTGEVFIEDLNKVYFREASWIE